MIITMAKKKTIPSYIIIISIYRYRRQQNKCYPHRCLLAHSLLAMTNLLARNNMSQICQFCKISLQSVAVNSSFCDKLTLLVVPFILLSMVHNRNIYKKMNKYLKS